MKARPSLTDYSAWTTPKPISAGMVFKLSAIVFDCAGKAVANTIFIDVENSGELESQVVGSIVRSVALKHSVASKTP